MAEHNDDSPSGADEAANPAGRFDSRLADLVKASAQEIWLAGMGAFAKAEAEGQKVFEALVREGAGLQRKTEAAAQAQFEDISAKVSDIAEEMGQRVDVGVERLESLFQARTEKALRSLGVPTSADFEALSARVEALAAAFEVLAQARAKPVQTQAESPDSPSDSAH
jgi:poly(hydroxyalkanoate) granule-associated protein